MLVQVEVRPDLVVLGMLADRRDEVGPARTQTINRIHRLLLEVVPGGARPFLSAAQASARLATTRPRDLVGKTRRRLAAKLITELRGRRQPPIDPDLISRFEDGARTLSPGPSRTSRSRRLRRK